MKSNLIPLLCFALAATGVPVLAETLEEVVVTASRTEQSIRDVDTNIARLSGETLSLVGHTHINESMQRVAGAWISRGNGQESLIALRSPVLTGAGACGAFLTLEDNIPLRASGFCNVNELFDANSEQAGAIEVIKGPAGVLYGSNAMHGMINVITAPVGGERTVSIDTGPHDYLRAKVGLGSDSWRIDANGTTDGGYKDNSGFDQQKVTIKHQGMLNDWSVTSAFSAANLNQETAGFIQGPLAYESDALRKSNPNPEAFRDTRSARLYSRFERELADKDRVVVTPYARYTDMRFIQHFLPGQAIEENSQKSIGVQSARYTDAWTYGLDAELTDGSLLETQPDPTTGSAFLVATIPQGDHYDYDVTATVIAAFAERRFMLTPSTRLSLGARAERVEYDYDNRMLDGQTRDDGTPCGFGGCRFNRPADRTDTFNNFSPKIGLSWLWRDRSQLFLFVSRGYRAPQATELYRLQGGQNVADIDSESLDSIEFGVRGSNELLSYSASTFVMRKDNVIFRDSNRANVDNGETSHQGIELSLGYQVSGALRASIDWTYAIHQYENSPALSSSNIEGNDVDTAPREFGSANLQWQVTPRVMAELEWVHMGKYYEDIENEQPYAGHDLLNVRLRARLSDRIDGFVRIVNATDTKYAERADFAFGNDRYFVGEPRSFYLGVTVDI